MKRSKFPEEQVSYALRQAESGTSVSDVCRQLGVSESTFFLSERTPRRNSIPGGPTTTSSDLTARSAT